MGETKFSEVRWEVTNHQAMIALKVIYRNGNTWLPLTPEQALGMSTELARATEEQADG